MTYAIIVKHDTWLKRSTAQSKTLPNNRKRIVLKGTVLLISGYRIVGDHIKISLGDDAPEEWLLFQRGSTWYALRAHVELLQDGSPLNLPPASVNLPISYRNYPDQYHHQEIQTDYMEMQQVQPIMALDFLMK